MINVFKFNGKVSYYEYIGIVVANIVIGLAVWSSSTIVSMPSVIKILSSYSSLLRDDALIPEVMSSGKLYVTVIFFMIPLASIIAYSSVIPALKPMVGLVCKLRAMSIIGLTMVFTVLTPNGYWLKVAIIVFAVTPWLVTSMCGIISSIPQDRFEYARTLKISEWKVVWHIVVRGELHQVIEAFRQVAMMIIVMLPVAEKLSKSDGGIGFLLSSLERFQTFDKIWAIQIIIVLIAIVQDYIIRQWRELLCPYAIMIEEGKR